MSTAGLSRASFSIPQVFSRAERRIYTHFSYGKETSGSPDIVIRMITIILCEIITYNGTHALE